MDHKDLEPLAINGSKDSTDEGHQELPVFSNTPKDAAKDYFSLHKPTSSYPQQITSPLSNFSLSSTSSFNRSKSNNSSTHLRQPNHLNLFLSPLMTIPTPTGSDESTAISSPNYPNDDHLPRFIGDLNPSNVLYELQNSAYKISKGLNTLNYSSHLPYDYLNMLPENDKPDIVDEYDEADIIKDMLKNYNLLNKLFNEEQSDIIITYVAEHKDTKQRLIIRFVTHSTIGTISRLINSYYVTSGLNTRKVTEGIPHLITQPGWNYEPRTCPSNIPGVLPCTELKFIKNSSSIIALYLIKPNIIPLIKLKIDLKGNILKIIKICINILKVLKSVQDFGIVINSLNPYNIFVNPETLEVYLMGFDFAFSSITESLDVPYRSANKLHSINYIPFTAPENFNSSISVDSRADFYSVGTSIYTLLSGRIFKNTNAMVMIISTLTVKHQPLNEINNSIPIEFSNVISKMIHINPNSRYSAIDHIIHDLVKVYSNLTSKVLTQDPISTLPQRIPIMIPNILIGREDTYKFLSSQILATSVKTFTLIGETGIGKTSILQKLKNMTLINKKLFTIWNCKNLNSYDSKFQTFDFILSQILRDILSMDKSYISFWKSLFVSNVKADFSVLFDTVPEMKTLLGLKYKYIKSSSIKMLYNKEVDHKFILKKIFELFSKYAGWVLIIENINDLSETESLLLEEFWNHLNNFEKGELNFTLLASYTTKKDKKLNDFNNVPEFLKNNIYEVKPLSFDNVQSIIKSCFHRYDSQFLWKQIQSKEVSYYYELDTVEKPLSRNRREFAESIFYKSKGNPLIIKELIINIHFSQLKFEETTNPIEIYKHCLETPECLITDALFLGFNKNNLNIYNSQTVNILKYAACVSNGNSFSFYDLFIVSGINISDLHKVIFTSTITTVLSFSSIVAKLPIGKLDDPSFILNNLSPIEKINLLKSTRYKFVHETIKLNLLSSMKETGELEEFHRKCGLSLLKTVEINDNNELQISSSDCFMIAYHFMKSWKVAKPNEYSKYSKILITAGWCAYSSYENMVALEFFQTAKNITTNLEIIKALEWIEVHIYTLKGEHEKSIELIENALIKYKHSPVDVAQLLFSKGQSLRILNRWSESYLACLASLKHLGFKLDLSKMTEEEIKQYTVEVLKPILPTSVSEIRQLRKLPPNLNRKILLTQMILSDLNQFSVYLGKTYLLSFCNLMNFSLFLEYGKSIYCCLSMIIIASIEASLDATGIKRAHEYCKLGFSMSNADTVEANNLFITSFRWYCSLVGSIIEPIEKIDQSFDASIIDSKTEIMQSTFTRGLVIKFKFHLWITQGLTLPRLIERMKTLKETFKPKKDPRKIFENIYNVVTDVLKVINGEILFDTFMNNKFDSDLTEMKALHINLIYHINRVFGCYFFKKYEIGAQIALNDLVTGWQEELASIELTWAKYGFVLLNYKDRVRRIDSNDLQDSESVEKINELMQNNHAFFEGLSKQNPSVFLCMFKTVDALIKALDDKIYSEIDILSAFESAVETCADYQNYLMEAIVAEECSRWLVRVTNNDKLPNKYIRIAYYSYKTWGLTIKVEQLQKEFSTIVKNNFDLTRTISKRKGTSGFFDQYSHSNQQEYNESNTCADSIKSPSVSSNSVTVKTTTSSNFDASFSSSIRLKNDEDVPDDCISWSSSRASVVENVPSSKFSDSNSLIDNNNEDTENIDDRSSDSDWDNEVTMDLSVKIVQSNDVEEIIRTLLLFALKFVNAEYGCLILNSDDNTSFIKAIISNNSEITFLSDEILLLRGDLAPVSLVQECIRNENSIWRGSDKFYFDTTFRSKDSYYENNNCENVFCIPIRSGKSDVVGAIYLENQNSSSFIPSKKIALLEYICLQSFISMTKIIMFERLEVAKRAAEEATADRTSFLANMSHEIRTPFNSLMSCAIFLLDTKLNKSQQTYVETIKNSALVTLNIIDGILSFSKLEHGSLTLDYELFNLNLCMEDAVQLVSEQTASKGLELVFVDKCYPISNIYGDKTRIMQIIINLLGNASKFTNEGYVLVENDIKEISKDRYEFIITVKDTGIGIPIGNKSRVFKVFNQLDGSSRREYGGSGLGLAISKKLAEYMGGDLDFKENSEGRGTEFTFTFTTKAEKYEIGKIFNNENNDNLIIIFDPRNLSAISLRSCIKRRGFKEENILHFDQIDDRRNSIKPTFIFIYYTLIEDEGEMKKLRDEYPNSSIVFMIPFGIKIPEYVEGDDDNGDNKSGLVDFVLLNPFKRNALHDILQTNKGKIFEKFKGKNEKKVDQKVDQKSPVKQKLGDTCPLSILIAEDNAINTKVVRLQLKRLGYDSIHAKDGIEVIEKTLDKIEEDGKPFDLILMDLQMPRMDGFEATEKIKAMYGDETRIVALSANVYAEEKNRCVNVGMSGFLNKPLLPDALSTQLQETHKVKCLKESDVDRRSV